MSIKRGPNIEYRDNSDLIVDALEKAINNGLTAIGMTAEGHAKRQTPVDTGRLRNSITHAVKAEEKAVYIGTNVEYAPFVELGTVKMRERPFLKPAATEHTEEYQRIMAASIKSAES